MWWTLSGFLREKNLPLSKPKEVATHILMFSCILNFLQKKRKSVPESGREKVNRIVMHEAGAQGDSVTVG